MMLLIIIVLIIAISIVIFLSNRKSINSKSHKLAIQITTITKDSVTVSKKYFTPGQGTELGIDEILELKNKRLIRWKHIGAILQYMMVVRDIYNSPNFYELDKRINEYNDLIIKLKDNEFHPNDKEIATAIRFCTIKHQQGKCDHIITQKEGTDIYNWDKYCLDSERILSYTTNSFKSYWDNVINSYIKLAAKRNRCNYLINHLNEMKNREILSKFPGFEQYANGLIQYYNNQLKDNLI